ncbi:MAG: hypothetical protein KKH52_02090 [Nanoarchaeota archaeon]|nr:hypothetical protein [Nanoarchaeota archaeon]MBU1622422.1 hypothetical protein [Nanoarchaeota archaeon]MBU1974162.1 hypothetical protein [Nanoarchaeota archaeon]
MKITITEKKDNKLLNRLEVKGTLEFEQVTPSNAKLSEALAKELNNKLELVIVKSIYNEFGQQNGTFFAIIYDSLEAKEKIEMNTKHLKKQAAEVAKKTEEEKAAAEEAKQKEAEEKAQAAEKLAEEKKEAPEEVEKAEEPQKETVSEEKKESAEEKTPEEPQIKKKEGEE